MRVPGLSGRGSPTSLQLLLIGLAVVVVTVMVSRSSGRSSTVPACEISKETLRLIESAAAAAAAAAGGRSSSMATGLGGAAALRRTLRGGDSAALEDEAGAEDGDAAPGAAALQQQDAAQAAAAASLNSGAGGSGAVEGLLVQHENADILRMDVQDMAREIELLRFTVATLRRQNAHLAETKRVIEESQSKASAAAASTASPASQEEVDQVKAQLDAAKAELVKAKSEAEHLKSEAEQARAQADQAKLEVEKVHSEVETCRMQSKFALPAIPVSAPITASNDTSWKGYTCAATPQDLQRYHNYTAGRACPNDWYFVQRLIFKKSCFALPRRRCRALTPERPSEPTPYPESLFEQSALKDENVRWDLHGCKSFACLNSRSVGECRNCFNMSIEDRRWRTEVGGVISIEHVVRLKNGTLRIGLDVGGGTGSFAARMARHGVTVLTSAFDVETIASKKAGLPYMETIALRGLVPLHLPYQARLPFFDGTLDMVHSGNSISRNIPRVDFEELAYEWDRVLRPGGILWLEMFFAPEEAMATYIGVLEALDYAKLHWNYRPPNPTMGAKAAIAQLNCVLEKRPYPGNEWLQGPRAKDMFKIV